MSKGEDGKKAKHKARHAKGGDGEAAAKVEAPKAAKESAPKLPSSKSLKLVTHALAALPALDDAERAALARQVSEATCDELGGRTRASGVLADAASWAPALVKQTALAPAALRYAAKRATWFCECAVALADAIAEANGGAGATNGAGTSAVAARAAARAAHHALAEPLEDLAGDDAAAKDALSSARGPNKTDDELHASLLALAGLADGWLARAKKDAGARLLLEDAGLDAALVQTARQRAADLAARTAAKTEAGAAMAKDPPSVNRAEGRVLSEMRVAYRRFAEAHDRDRTVPRFTPGHATKRVVGYSGSAKSPKSPKSPPDQAPAPLDGT